MNEGSLRTGACYSADMVDIERFRALSPTILADVLRRARVMDVGMKPLWAGAPHGSPALAFPVRCPKGDNLMLHAAIYRALRPAPSSYVRRATSTTPSPVATCAPSHNAAASPASSSTA